MELELVDVVNEQDRVIGTAYKQECHEKGLLHRTIIAQVIGSDGNWTLVRQASDRQDAGQLVSPVGGHIKAGESEEDALKRETLEEVGITEFQYKFVDKIIFNREVIGRKENHYFILYEIYSDQKLVLNHESVSFEKFSKKQLLEELSQNPNKFGNAFHFVMKEVYRFK